MDLRKALENAANTGLLGRLGIVAVPQLAIFLLIAPFAGLAIGSAAVNAALVAFLLCLVGSLLAVVIAWFLAPHAVENNAAAANAAFIEVLVGMFVRMGIPLAGAIFIKLQSPGLTEAGFFAYLVVFFGVGWVAATLLSAAGTGKKFATATPGATESTRSGDPSQSPKRSEPENSTTTVRPGSQSAMNTPEDR